MGYGCSSAYRRIETFRAGQGCIHFPSEFGSPEFLLNAFKLPQVKMAVLSQDPKIDCIGACVGVRGSRIKAVIDELRGERIDIIRWSDSLETLIMNGLKPATIHIDNIFPDVDTHSAVVIVDEDQQSLAIGKKGQNVRLASRLCGWDIDIKTRAEFFGEDEQSAGSGPDPGPDARPVAGTANRRGRGTSGRLLTDRRGLAPIGE